MPRQAGKQCRCSDHRLVPRVGMVGHLHLLLGHGDAISSAIAMPYHRVAGNSGSHKAKSDAVSATQVAWWAKTRTKTEVPPRRPCSLVIMKLPFWANIPSKRVLQVQVYKLARTLNGPKKACNRHSGDGRTVSIEQNCCYCPGTLTWTDHAIGAHICSIRAVGTQV